MSSSLDSDVFLSNDEEYLKRLARPVTRSQLNSNQSNNNDDESDHDNNNDRGQDSVLSQVDLQPNSEGGANPNTEQVEETRYSDQQDVDIFIAGLSDVKDDATGIPKIILDRINANYDHQGWKPDLKGIMSHSRYKFMLNVLLKSETIALEVSKLMSPNLVDEYYVCPAVMIELIKEDKYVMDGNDTVPASYRDIKEARRKVKAFEWNSHLKKFDEL